MIKTRRPLMERFEKKVFYASPDGCWYWIGAVSSSGYGYFWIHGKRVMAHRASYMMFKKNDLKELKVLHSCDNQLCVNPYHLSLGTQKDNMADMKSRGRERKVFGENVSILVLTEDQVRSIRNELMEGCRRIPLSKKYCVGLTAIRNIDIGKTWKHVK